MTVEEANMVADKIALLNKEYNSRLVSSDLQILRPYLQSMETMAVLRTVSKKSQPFALTLALGSIGIFESSSSDLGLIGPALEKVIRSISLGIDVIQPNQPIGDKKVLIDGATFIIVGMMVLAAFGATEGTANTMYDEDAQKEINSFSLELLFEMILYSNTSEFLFETLTEVANLTPTKAKEVTAALTLVALLLTIWTISKEKGPNLEMIIANSKPKIIEYLKKIEIMIENQAEKTGQNTEMFNGLVIGVKQTLFAIESDDYAKLIEAINGLLRICEVKLEELDEDINRICLQTKMILDLLRETEEGDLKAVTGIWQTG